MPAKIQIMIMSFMLMKRTVYDDLLAWKNNESRKPLLLEGVRQCGKTYILKKFGKREYDDVAYFMLQNNPKIHRIFRTDSDPRRMIDELGVARKKKIEPKKTLIILDEIQSCGEALTSLKFFCDDAPEYHIACAGSLLGVMMAVPHSFPVGKVDRINMYPMSFKEFLLANSEDLLVEYIEKNVPMNGDMPFIETLNTYLDYYFLTGGMPEAVASWVGEKDIRKVDSVLDRIIRDYETDFSKHAPELLAKMTMIWHSIPVQLAKDNKKFVFGHVKTGARSKDLEDALEWLVNAGLVHKVRRVNRPEVPLSMFADNTDFKVYLADVGVLRRMSGAPSNIMFSRDKEYATYRGVAAENFVLNELITSNGDVPYYWRSDGISEVDFVAQMGGSAIPIEVKAGSTKSKSIGEFIKRYGSEIAVITSPRKDKREVVTYVPLPLIWMLRNHILMKIPKSVPKII